jgi:hypothetical protein
LNYFAAIFFNIRAFECKIGYGKKCRAGVIAFFTNLLLYVYAQFISTISFYKSAILPVEASKYFVVKK